MKVMIVDDEPDIRRLARLALQRLGGMEVVESEGGVGVVVQALGDRPDVILLDVVMPALDGPAVLALLRQEPATRELPVIFLTGKTTESEVWHLRSLGAAGVLAKPFDPRRLARDVRGLWERRSRPGTADSIDPSPSGGRPGFSSPGAPRSEPAAPRAGRAS